MVIELFKHIYFKMPLIIRLLLSIFVLMGLFGLIIFLVEPDQFPSVFDGIWWAFVTGATVGYGDFVPVTVPGKIVGILLILSGGGLLTYYITAISATTIEHEEDLSQGKVGFKGINHIVIVGWNERTRQLVEMIAAYNAQQEMVLIDQTLKHLPYQRFPVHFIHGDPSEDNILTKANIEHAASVMVTSDQTKQEKQADISSILTVVAIRGNNKDVSINAEILTDNQIENAKRAGTDNVISSNDFMSTLFYHELFHKKNTKPFASILELLNKQQIIHRAPPSELHGKKYQEGVLFYLDKHELLFGIIREKDWIINPVKELIFQEGDILLLLVAWEQ